MRGHWPSTIALTLLLALGGPVGSDAQAPRTIAVGKGPEALLIDGAFVWVAGQFSDTVTRIDPTGRLPAKSGGRERPVARIRWHAHLLRTSSATHS